MDNDVPANNLCIIVGVIPCGYPSIIPVKPPCQIHNHWHKDVLARVTARDYPISVNFTYFLSVEPISDWHYIRVYVNRRLTLQTKVYTYGITPTMGTIYPIREGA